MRQNKYLNSSQDFRMFPTQQLVEQAIEACGKPAVATKTPGGGRVTPKKGVQLRFPQDGCLLYLGWHRKNGGN